MSTELSLNVSREEAPEAAHVSHPMITSNTISKDCEKSSTLLAKGAPLSMEKLWEGTVQLNPAMTVSMAAFFKSGERMSDVNWSKLVEVKGKVKFEAFEKYIEDLPRSRSRCLTVISLCWKPGSSKASLEWMKKIEKKYKEENRVGLAKISPGVDIYVCPRSETIFTILAKHGFFKGVEAIEDNQNSFIGCVVWRKKQTDPKCMPEKAVNNAHLSQKSVSATSGLSMQRELVNNVSSAPSSVEFDRKDVLERRAERAERDTGSNSKLLPRSQSLAVVAKSFVSGKQSLKTKDALASNLGQEQDRRVDLQQPKPIVPPDVKKRILPALDIDDLPEFDYGPPRGISSSAAKIKKPLAAVTVDRNFPDGVSRNKERLLRPSETVPSQTRDLASEESRKLPPMKRACFRDSVAMGIAGSISGDPRRRNLFKDRADDMPEWSPPCALPENQSLTNTDDSSAVRRSLTRPLAATARPPLPHQGHKSVPHPPSNSVQQEGRRFPSPPSRSVRKFFKKH